MTQFGRVLRVTLYNQLFHKLPASPCATVKGDAQMNQKEWTIMIYMAGDNNLAVDMAYAMEQIKSVAASGADSQKGSIGLYSVSL